MVKQHGGLIHVYSEPQRGTSFRVYLPFRAESPEPVAPEPGGDLVGGSERLFLAEDDDALRLSTTKLLGHLGYQVEGVASGGAAPPVLGAPARTFALALPARVL